MKNLFSLITPESLLLWERAHHYCSSLKLLLIICWKFATAVGMFPPQTFKWLEGAFQDSAGIFCLLNVGKEHEIWAIRIEECPFFYFIFKDKTFLSTIYESPRSKCWIKTHFVAENTFRVCFQNASLAFIAALRVISVNFLCIYSLFRCNISFDFYARRWGSGPGWVCGEMVTFAKAPPLPFLHAVWIHLPLQQPEG